MLGCNIYFCISTSPVLCIMGSCRLDISWFFLDHFSLFYALDQCCGFCCLIHRPSVSSTGNIHRLAGRCRDRSCRTDCIISLAKFPHPLFYLILIKGNIHIFIIRQPLWDQSLVDYDIFFHLISDTGFQILIHRITGRLDFRWIWSILWQCITTFIQHIQFVFELCYVFLNFLFQHFCICLRTIHFRFYNKRSTIKLRMGRLWLGLILRHRLDGLDFTFQSVLVKTYLHSNIRWTLGEKCFRPEQRILSVQCFLDGSILFIFQRNIRSANHIRLLVLLYDLKFITVHLLFDVFFHSFSILSRKIFSVDLRIHIKMPYEISWNAKINQHDTGNHATDDHPSLLSKLLSFFFLPSFTSFPLSVAILFLMLLFLFFFLFWHRWLSLCLCICYYYIFIHTFKSNRLGNIFFLFTHLPLFPPFSLFPLSYYITKRFKSTDLLFFFIES